MCLCVDCEWRDSEKRWIQNPAQIDEADMRPDAGSSPWNREEEWSSQSDIREPRAEASRTFVDKQKVQSTTIRLVTACISSLELNLLPQGVFVSQSINCFMSYESVFCVILEDRFWFLQTEIAFLLPPHSLLSTEQAAGSYFASSQVCRASIKYNAVHWEMFNIKWCTCRGDIVGCRHSSAVSRCSTNILKVNFLRI